MTTFQNREKEIIRICTASEQTPLLNIFGEAGIGKSRLLNEAAVRLRSKSPPTVVLEINLGELDDIDGDERTDTVLRILSHQATWLSVSRQNRDQAAARMVMELSDRGDDIPLFLLFDNSDAVQEDTEFWRWMEKNLIGPLVVEGEVQIVFAGRVPAPWRRIEVRRVLKLVRLHPLSHADAARDLIEEVLLQHRAELEGDELQAAIRLALEFSFGHPMLSEQLATHIAQWWSPAEAGTFGPRLCNEIVKPFIEDYFFDDIDPTWQEILWWASVLEWFDPTVLQRFLLHVAPELVKDQSDFFFVQGITRLRMCNTVIWRESTGDRLHGVIGPIVRHCLQVVNPDRYRKACRAAAQTFRQLAAEFHEESPEARQYLREADLYHHEAEQEAK
jgi:hypothetical protein